MKASIDAWIIVSTILLAWAGLIVVFLAVWSRLPWDKDDE